MFFRYRGIFIGLSALFLLIVCSSTVQAQSVPPGSKNDPYATDVGTACNTVWLVQVDNQEPAYWCVQDDVVSVFKKGIYIVHEVHLPSGDVKQEEFLILSSSQAEKTMSLEELSSCSLCAK